MFVVGGKFVTDSVTFVVIRVAWGGRSEPNMFMLTSETTGTPNTNSPLRPLLLLGIPFKLEIKSERFWADGMVDVVLIPPTTGTQLSIGVLVTTQNTK